MVAEDPPLSFKRLFSRSLSAAPGRLHMAAHSHHLWPDATREAQAQYWDDSAELADRKWDKVMGEVLPEARAHVAAELSLPDPNSVVFAPNTHTLIVALFSALKTPARVLATDEEFHSFRRQSARWVEEGRIELEVVPADRFVAAARSGRHDLIFASHVSFKSGRVFEDLLDLADLASPEGPWLIIDGYHGFRGVPTDLSAVADRCFYLAGGYKYAMAGEGCAFMHAPEGFGPRPAITGWYAEFSDLEGPPGGVGYARDASRFMGATFDPSGLYRFNAAARMLKAEGLTTTAVGKHVRALQAQLVEGVSDTPLTKAQLLNSLDEGRPHARFLAFRHPDAQAWKSALMERDIVTDVRGDVLRIGLGLYHDAADIDRFRREFSALA
ncbi:MAG TPA: aminotransferase class V-fold PLP-dependent enzyme [Caulobacteraceae bacterium]|nr:aminotransferase class V-fold PLP-dependent enzyme [Caulobacteraceae bacterium]